MASMTLGYTWTTIVQTTLGTTAAPILHSHLLQPEICTFRQLGSVSKKTIQRATIQRLSTEEYPPKMPWYLKNFTSTCVEQRRMPCDWHCSTGGARTQAFFCLFSSLK
ncbi:unnamed protein product, partial [Ectocarpus fasciculatus]